MQHFAGFHSSLEIRTAFPKPFLAFYLGILEQSEQKEAVNIIGSNEGEIEKYSVGPPPKTEPLQPREDYETSDAVGLQTFGETVMRPLGDVALGRSVTKVPM